MRILFVGDVVGRAGRTALAEYLPGMVSDWALDLVVVNGENAAGGFGITEAIYQELVEAGADVVTLGNHAWDQREALVFIERAPRLLRPLNFPPGTPGRVSAVGSCGQPAARRAWFASRRTVQASATGPTWPSCSKRPGRSRYGR